MSIPSKTCRDIREQSNPTVKERIVCKRGPCTEVQIKYAHRLKFGLNRR